MRQETEKWNYLNFLNDILDIEKKWNFHVIFWLCMWIFLWFEKLKKKVDENF